MTVLYPCAGPGIFARGDPGPTARKQPGCFFCFFSPVYRGDPMVLLQRKLYFPKDPEGVQHFLGWGGPTFSRGGGGGGGGPNANFCRNTYNLVIFQEVQTPYPPIWSRTWLYPYPNPYSNEVSYKGTVLFDY